MHVAHAQLGRVHAQLRGQLVHLPLVGGADLHGALAAHVARRRVVGAHRPALDEDVRDDVGAGGEGDGGGQRVGGGVGVGARVQQDLRLDLDQAALGVGVVAVAQQRGVAVGVAEEGLLAGGGELDRAAGLQRQQAERELEAGVLAVADGAGHAGDDDLDPRRAPGRSRRRPGRGRRAGRWRRGRARRRRRGGAPRGRPRRRSARGPGGRSGRGPRRRPRRPRRGRRAAAGCAGSGCRRGAGVRRRRPSPGR